MGKATGAAELRLQPTECAICRSPGKTRELYPQRLSEAAFRPSTFSARRLPDRLHYRTVQCLDCGLVRADPIADARMLARLYELSSFDYGDQVPSLRLTYRRYLEKLDAYGARKGSLLEIGCGDGFFLRTAVEMGYRAVRGVEPSTEAVDRADSWIRPNLICDVMRPGLFEAGEFDVICLFQVLDHVLDPGSLLDECRRILRPGGLILCLNHNVDALSARLLRDRSPIIDVEHTYLYSPRTMRRIFADHGFAVRHVGPVFNTYGLNYLVWLMPLPGALKRLALVLSGLGMLKRLRLSVPLGNLYLVGQKSA